MSSKIILFQQDYDGESLYDLDRDISEAFDERYNPEVKNLKMEDGFIKGIIRVTVEVINEKAY